MLLIVTVCFISFPLSFIVSVVSVDVHFYKPVSFVTLVTAVSGRLCLLKILFRCLLLIVTVRFISFPLSFIVSVVSVVDVQFLSPFHSLHLFQLFQADCVYKKSLEDACYLLLQSVSLVFYSFSLFQLFQWKMSNFFKPVSFVTLVSAVSGRLCL